jgi:hypothetical protein
MRGRQIKKTLADKQNIKIQKGPTWEGYLHISMDKQTRTFPERVKDIQQKNACDTFSL